VRFNHAGIPSFFFFLPFEAEEDAESEDVPVGENVGARDKEGVAPAAPFAAADKEEEEEEEEVFGESTREKDKDAERKNALAAETGCLGDGGGGAPENESGDKGSSKGGGTGSPTGDTNSSCSTCCGYLSA